MGQPELGALLASDDLRQLNQRITLSCHLIPLTLSETREYIRHRIHIASSKPGLEFTAGAYRSIFNYTGGVPRLINIACDRALQTHGGMGYAREYHVERYWREARLQRLAPVSQEMTLNYIAQQVLGLLTTRDGDLRAAERDQRPAVHQAGSDLLPESADLSGSEGPK